jgi:hypothetical protein
MRLAAVRFQLLALQAGLLRGFCIALFSRCKAEGRVHSPSEMVARLIQLKLHHCLHDSVRRSS